MFLCASGVYDRKSTEVLLRSYLAFLDLLLRSLGHFWLPFGLFWQSWELNEQYLYIENKLCFCILDLRKFVIEKIIDIKKAIFKRIRPQSVSVGW